MAFDRSLVEKISEVQPNSAGLEELLAEARVAFVEWAQGSLAQARASVDALATDKAEDANAVVYGVFHDLKGSGGGVGYHLLSGIGDSGCAFLRAASLPNAEAVRVATAHIVAAEGVLAARIEGDGGVAGAAILEKLRTSAKKVA